jgi:predicted small integral membrane protein
VFLFDLAAQTAMYRVTSFIALGVLLLLGALAWERARPRMGPRDVC